MGYQFDFNNNQWLSCNSPVTSSPFTVCAWFRTSFTNERRIIVSIADSGSGDNLHAMRTDTDGSLQYRRQAGATQRIVDTTTAPIVPDTWFHGCFVYEASGNGYVYVNGGGRSAGATASPTSIDRLGIGANADSSPSDYFGGDIGPVSVWNVVLTDAEVAAHAQGVSSWKVRPQALVFDTRLLGPPRDLVGSIPFTNNGGAIAGGHPPITYFVRSLRILSLGPVENTPTPDQVTRSGNTGTLIDISGNWSGPITSFGALVNAPPNVSISSAGVISQTLDATDIGQWDNVTYTAEPDSVVSTPFSIRVGALSATARILAGFSSDQADVLTAANFTYTGVSDDGEQSADAFIPVENHPPLLAPIADQNVIRSQGATIPFSVTDADGDLCIFAIDVNNEAPPPEFTVDDNLDNTGEIVVAPGAALGGYTIRLYAYDQDPLNAMSHSITFELTVAAFASAYWYHNRRR